MFNKMNKDKKKVLVIFDLFAIDNNISSLVEDIKDEYVLDYPNLFDLYGNNEKDMDQWIRNCRQYLGNLAKNYEEVNLLGYSMGSILAGNCAALPFIEKIILIEPSYWYMEYQGSKKAFYSDKLNKILVDLNIKVTLFSIIYTKLTSDFDGQIKQSSAEMLIFQKLGDYSIESKMMKGVYQNMDKQRVKLVQIGTEEQDCIADASSKNIVKLLINDFLNR